MKSAYTLAATLLLMTLGAPLVSADVILMDSGDDLKGTVLGDDGTEVEFETFEGLTMKLPYANIAPESVFDLMAHRTAADDADGQIALGDYGAEHGLYRAAKAAYARAATDDPTKQAEVDKKLAAMTQEAGASLMAEAKQAQSEGRNKDARSYLAEILKQHPNSADAKDASAMLTSINDDLKAEHDKAMAGQETKELGAELEPVSKMYKTMLDKVRDGLQNSANQSGSIDDLKRALDEGQRAEQKIAELRKTAQDGGPLAESLDKLDGEIKQESQEATVHLADAYSLRGSNNQATEVINKALAADPNNQQLIALREQIAANNSDSNVGYGVGLVRGGIVRGRR